MEKRISYNKRNNLNVLLIDDSKEYVDYFSKLIEDFCNDNAIKIELFSCSNFSFSDLSNRSYDIAFLDIDMPKISGFEVAKYIASCCPYCNIVYVSGKTELVWESFEHSIVTDFIPKDCQKTILDRKLERIFSKKTIGFYEFIADCKEIVVPKINIIYIQKERNDLFIYTTEKIYKTRVNLIDALKELNKDGCFFSQINKSTIVNLMHVEDIDTNKIFMDKDFELHISRMYLSNFKKTYSYYKTIYE